jgi:hypothetical protein
MPGPPFSLGRLAVFFRPADGGCHNVFFQNFRNIMKICQEYIIIAHKHEIITVLIYD